MIKLKDVSKFYYNKGIISSGFSRLNAEFNIGEFVVITGESGSGKSTLLNVISGLDTYEEGEMYINGAETSHYTESDFEDYRKKYISNIFQNFNLVNSYTVYQNIELVLLINGFKRKEVKKKILEIIKEVELTKYKNTKVSKLSGGQKQRVAIARALAKNTPIIIADEPTGNLDSRSAESVMRILSEVSKDKLVIIVTHNYEQVDKYTTRKITMHDGKIIEDKVIKKNDSIEAKVNKDFKQISFGNKLRLGMRNAFNIVPKFLLILIVYLFVSCALTLEYSSLQSYKVKESSNKYNSYFRDKSENRIILQKKDKTPFTEDDYNKIQKIDNVDYIIKNDYSLDTYSNLTNNDNIYVYGKSKNINLIKEKLSHGTLPKNDNEIVISGPKNDYYLSNPDKILNEKVYFVNDNTGEIDYLKEYIIVGVLYNSTDDYDDYTIYGTDAFIEDSYQKNIVSVTNIKTTINEQDTHNMIMPLEVVPLGTAYVNESLNSFCKNYNCLNKNVNLELKTIYYDNKTDLKITKLLNSDNFKKATGLKDYYANNNFIFVNPTDYNNLFSSDVYQSSVFVKDTKIIHETEKLLEQNNIDALVLNDALVASDAGITYILNIVSAIVTGILIIIMFFISYFIIKLILKSRNVYYSTLRILGSNKKTAKELLIIELFTISDLAIVLTLATIILINNNVIVLTSIKDLLSYLKIKDYLLIYVIISAMTYLISMKFSKKLFKNSAMKTYNEEV